MILDCNPTPISLTNLTLLGLSVDATVVSLGLFADVPVALLVHCIFRGNRMIRARYQRRTATQSNKIAKERTRTTRTTKQQNNHATEQQQSNRYKTEQTLFSSPLSRPGGRDPVPLYRCRQRPARLHHTAVGPHLCVYLYLTLG